MLNLRGSDSSRGRVTAPRDQYHEGHLHAIQGAIDAATALRTGLLKNVVDQSCLSFG
jgi:hypothetical protein